MKMDKGLCMVHGRHDEPRIHTVAIWLNLLAHLPETLGFSERIAATPSSPPWHNT